MKPKLTPTFNDMAAEAKGNGHLPMNMALQHVPSLPSFPLPPKIVEAPAKRKAGRPKNPAKEQTVNLAPLDAKKPLKIALIGTAPSSRLLAPYSDPSWTIWACSPGNMNAIPRADAWFEIHGARLLWPEHKSYGEPYIAWLKTQTIPVYMQDKVLVPNATLLPKDELVKEFGPYFFTSSFAWMMALAIQQGATEIALFGIDMASKDEYIIQRPGAYHFFQEGARRGVKMWAPHESDIMQPPGLYGFSDVQPFLRKLLARQKEIQDRLAPMEQQYAGLGNQITYLKGALEDLDYTISIQGGAQDNAKSEYLNELIQKASLTQNSN